MSAWTPLWAIMRNLLMIFFIWTTFLCPALGLKHEGYMDRQAGDAPQPTASSKDLLCTPFGACEPCPPDDMNEPFCQPFGNRRLVHCVNTTFTTAHPQDQTVPNGQSGSGRLTTLQPNGELPAWESCGRIVEKERADFYEFVACNVVFAAIALCVLFFRSRRMQVNQARQLAARIGLIRGDGGRVLRP